MYCVIIASHLEVKYVYLGVALLYMYSALKKLFSKTKKRLNNKYMYFVNCLKINTFLVQN